MSSRKRPSLRLFWRSTVSKVVRSKAPVRPRKAGISKTAWRRASSGTAMPRRFTSSPIAAWVISRSSVCPAMPRRMAGVGSVRPPSMRLTWAICWRKASWNSGTSILRSPTVARDVSLPAFRATSATPHMTKGMMRTMKNSLAARVFRNLRNWESIGAGCPVKRAAP